MTFFESSFLHCERSQLFEKRQKIEKRLRKTRKLKIRPSSTVFKRIEMTKVVKSLTMILKVSADIFQSTFCLSQKLSSFNFKAICDYNFPPFLDHEKQKGERFEQRRIIHAVKSFSINVTVIEN